MQESIDDIFLLGIREYFVPLYISIVVNDTANVLHRTAVVIRDKHLIKLCKWVWCGEKLLVEIDCTLCASEVLFFCFVNILFQRLSAIQF